MVAQAGYASSRLPTLDTRLSKRYKLQVAVMDDVTPTTSSDSAGETSRLSPRALSQIAGEVAAILRGPPTSSSNPLSLSTTDAATVSTTPGIHS